MKHQEKLDRGMTSIYMCIYIYNVYIFVYVCFSFGFSTIFDPAFQVAVVHGLPVASKLFKALVLLQILINYQVHWIDVFKDPKILRCSQRNL